jgi:alpha-galactosidase
VDDEMRGHESETSVVFQVFADEKCLAQSPVIHLNELWRFTVQLPQGSRRLRLVVTDAGDGINCDHGDWANAGFLLAR